MASSIKSGISGANTFASSTTKAISGVMTAMAKLGQQREQRHEHRYEFDHLGYQRSDGGHDRVEDWRQRFQSFFKQIDQDRYERGHRMQQPDQRRDNAQHRTCQSVYQARPALGAGIHD